MNLSNIEAQNLIQDLEKSINSSHEIVVIPSFLQIPAVSMHAEQIAVGAQDCYFEKNGAFTGEISVEMLKEFSVRYVVTGHSERRHVIGESDELINKKNKAIVEDGISAIFCIGETESQKNNGVTLEILEEQITQGLKDIQKEKLKNIVIAYEPVWAIGTGKSATRKDAEEAMGFIFNVVDQNFGAEIANEMPLLYGGSVKPENISDFSQSDYIDGVLVGGASLIADDFKGIASQFKK